MSTLWHIVRDSSVSSFLAGHPYSNAQFDTNSSCLTSVIHPLSPQTTQGTKNSTGSLLYLKGHTALTIPFSSLFYSYCQWALDFSLWIMKNLYLSPLPLVVLQAWQLPPCLRIGQLMDCLFGTGTHMGSPVRCGTNPGLELLPRSTGNSGACSQQTSKPNLLCTTHSPLCSTYQLQLHQRIPSVNLLYSEGLRFLLGTQKLRRSQPQGFHPGLDPSQVCWGRSSVQCSGPHSPAGAGWAKQYCDFLNNKTWSGLTKTEVVWVVLDSVALFMVSKELSLFSWAADTHPFPLLRKFLPLLVGKVSFPTAAILLDSVCTSAKAHHCVLIIKYEAQYPHPPVQCQK